MNERIKTMLEIADKMHKQADIQYAIGNGRGGQALATFADNLKRDAEFDQKRLCPAHNAYHDFAGPECPPCACKLINHGNYFEEITDGCTIHGRQSSL